MMLSLLDLLQVVSLFARSGFAPSISSRRVAVAPLYASVPVWKELAVGRLRDASAESVSFTVNAFKVINVRLRLFTEAACTSLLKMLILLDLFQVIVHLFRCSFAHRILRGRVAVAPFLAIGIRRNEVTESRVTRVGFVSTCRAIKAINW